MSDRLRELQRQRSLAQEQLAWLDREIAAASGNVPPATPGSPAPIPAAPTASEVTTVDAEAIIAKYQNDAGNLQTKVKRGCFAYFALAFVLVGLGVLALYLHTSRK